VRRNRRRFWKSDDGDDKQSAYLTLYECLDIIQRIIAPFMPFLSEQIYQNLSKCDKDASQSVHLSQWPEFNPDYLNDDLVFEMDIVQTIVGLGRSAREESRVRVRQPLTRILVSVSNEAARDAIVKHSQQILEELNIKSVEFISSDAELISYSISPNFSRLGKRYGKLMTAIKDALGKSDSLQIAKKVQANENFDLDIGGQSIEISPQDIQVQTSSAEGYCSSSADDCMVALDTSLNDELINEGIARELVRSVQDARKSAGLQISDRIVLGITGSSLVIAALTHHRNYIMSETLAVELDSEFETGFQVERALGEENWRITLAKSKS